MAWLIVLGSFGLFCYIVGLIHSEAKEEWEARQQYRAYEYMRKKQERLETQPWLPPDYNGPLPDHVPHYGLVDLTTGEVIK